MEAARRAAVDGHEVVLAEQAGELGGRLTLAALTYQPHAELLVWLRRQVRRAPIEVRLNSTMNAEQILTEGADLVIVATGGRWPRPDVPGAHSPSVYTVDQLGGFLSGSALGDLQHVVVLGGDRVGVALAHTARGRGLDVVVLEPSEVLCLQAGLPGRWRLLHDLQAAGVELVRAARDIEVRTGHVHWSDPDGTARKALADAVFAAGPVEPDRAPADALADAGVRVEAIGDCHATDSALIEGALLAASQVVATI
jgi:pyruvate/2-oxoglutarate dehydrogenase complex dihydrolipoamide dehydrogenase (E3) component